ncbi:carbohydrate-binding protein [Prevotella sp. P5-92]|uniref:RagB/SusD family nutrient uptake outer membrane protein n=1 Tax=Prevotella sp. P5-92 TaxID=2024222 RepID=UPI000B9786EB|nr:RagB/SusD family nutrient uptake outer membrane protein [Prevotella sp. P5-92]OYP58467.1 carbohydrate-binding protein [Prevotella sp. P5-92]
MKIYKISTMVLGGLMLASCSDIDEQIYSGGAFSKEQSQDIVNAIPTRVEATFNGLFTFMGNPAQNYGTRFSSARADDFGFIMMALSQDFEGADMIGADNGYNWFSAACEYSSRTPSYANPYIRYVTPYTLIGMVKEILATIPEDTEDASLINMKAQAKTLRAYSYLSLAPYFQGSYETSKDKPCVPVLSDSVDVINNPRATVEQVYNVIVEDLTWAIDHLDETRSSKAYVNANVAYGLRARAYLAMGKGAEAAADAEKAMQGYEPASIAEVSVPTFCDMEEHNWIWAIDITDDQANYYGYATAPSWLSAFCGDGYGAACGTTAMINKLLWDKIPATDVRKGWWIDENLHSPNWADLTWGTAKGDEIANLVLDDGSKVELPPYTNIKFGMKSGVGSTLNNNDWPLMRVEEMILIQAEGYAISGNEAKAKEILTNFVKTYRDPSYTIPSGRTLRDEIWFQRRVELWGEGFAVSDARRLNKPIVRFHGPNTTNYADAFQFNIAADDGWLNMRFPQSEMDNNRAIVDNEEGSLPVSGQNPNLRDGVTD